MTFSTSAVSIFAGVIVLSALACSRAENESVKSDLASERTQWMYDGKVGISTHYCPWRIDEVEDVANAFQVDKVAEQAAQAGAKWFLLTMHHQPWLMMAPNKTYDEILGHSNYTSERDVPMELYDALSERDIRMMIYLNLRLDPGSICSRIDKNIPKSMGNWPPDKTMIDNISAVYREYSLRYGKRVSGWWLDGAWMNAYLHAKDREKWFATIAEALRAGNPDAAVAFNPGTERWYRLTDINDYLAGETDALTFQPDEGRLSGGAQWHAWTYLGKGWAKTGCRFDTARLVEHARAVTAKGGVLTFDLGTYRPAKAPNTDPQAKPVENVGCLDPLQIEQVRAVTDAVWESKN